MADEGGTKSISGHKRDQGQRDSFEDLFIAMSSLLEDAASPFSLTVFSQLVEAIQIFSFAFAPIYGYSLIAIGELSYAAYATRLPVWDGTTMGYVSIGVPFGILIACLLLVAFAMITFACTVVKYVERHGYLSTAAAVVIQTFSGLLFIPSLHLAMAPLFCKSGQPVWFPNYSGQCFDGLHSAVFAIGIMSAFVFAIHGFVGATFFCRIHNGTGAGDPSTSEGNVMDRAHPYAEVVLAIGKLIVVLFYHILLGLANSPTAFNVLLGVFCIVAVLVHAVLLPFHTQFINQFRCGVYLSTLWAAALNVAFVGGAPTLASRQVHSYLLFVGLPLVFYIGLRIADYRVSDEAEHRLERLRVDGRVAVHEPRYPFSVYLLENDTNRLPPKYKGLESDLVSNDPPREELSDHRARMMEFETQLLMPEQIIELTECLVSWLDVVRFSTDAEVATRTLTKFSRLTRNPPTGSALAFALRIFTKTLLLTQNAGITSVQLASLVFYHCTKLNFPLEITDAVDRRTDVDMWVLFMSMRLGVEVKRFFGLRDAARIETFNAAKRLHKHALHSIAGFWSKLTSGANDLVGIIHLTNSLTAQRIGAFDTYQRALQTYGTDRQLLMLYSAFLADVMLEPRAAAQIKAFAEELAEEKRSRMLQNKSGGRSGDNTAALAVGGEQSTVHSAESSQGSGDRSTSALHGMNKSRFTPTVMVMILFIGMAVLAGSGIFIAQVVGVTRDMTSLSAMDALGLVYSNIAAADAQLYEMRTASINSFDPNTDFSDPTATLLATITTSSLQTLASAEANFSANANRFVVSSTGFANILPPTMVRVLFDLGSVWLDVGTGTDSWSSPVAASLFGAVGDLRAAVTASVNAAAQVTDYTFYSGVLSNNANGAISEAVTLASSLLKDGIEYRARTTVAVAAALMIIALISLVVAYFAVHINLENGGNMKATVIQLFTLIPLATQQALETEARRRIESFDQWEDEENKGAETNHDQEASEAEESTHRSSLARSSSAAVDTDGTRHGSMMLGRKRANTSDRVKGVLRHLSNYTATGSRRDPNAKKRRVQFNLPEQVRKADAPAKKIQEPKVMLQVSDSADSSAANAMHTAKKNKASSARKEAQQHSNTQLYQAASATLIAFTVCILTIGLGAATVARTQVMSSTRGDELALKNWVARSSMRIADIQSSARAYVSFGLAAHYSEFTDAVGSQVVASMYTPPASIKVSDTQVRERAAALRPAVTALLARLQIAVAIAAEYYGGSGSSTPDAFLTQWAADSITPAAMGTYSGIVNVTVPDFNSSDAVRAAAASARLIGDYTARTAAMTAIRETAVKALSSPRANADFAAVQDALASLQAETIAFCDRNHEVDDKDRKQLLSGAVICAAVLSVVFTVTVVGVILTTSQQRTLGPDASLAAKIRVAFKYRALDVTITLCGCIAAWVCFWILIGAVATPVKDANDSGRWAAFFDHTDRFVISDHVIGSFALSADSKYSIQYLTAQYRTQDFNAVSGFAASSSVASSGATALADFLRYANISYTLGAWGTGLQYRTSAIIAIPLTSTYDVAQEQSYAVDVAAYQYDHPELQYTNFARDISTQNASTLLQMARHALFGERSLGRRAIIANAFASVVEGIASMNDAAAKANYSVGLVVAAMVFAAIAFFATFLLTLLNGTAQLRTTAGVAGEEDLLSSLFSSTIRQSAAAVTVLGLIIVVQFIIAAAYQTNASTMTGVLWNAHRRQAHVAETLRLADEMYNLATTGTQPINLFPLSVAGGTLTRLRMAQSKLCTAKANLDDAHIATTSSAIGKTSGQQAATTGGSNPLSVQLLAWGDYCTTLCTLDFAAQPSGIVVVSNTSVPPLSFTAYSIDSSTRSSISTIVTRLRVLIQPLWAALDSSTATYKSDAESLTFLPVIPAAVLVALLLIIAFMEDRLIFDPAGDKIALEEHGAKLLLNMIPPAVRQVVPKIRLYLDTGVIVKPEAEQEAHTLADAVISEFVTAWQGGVSEQDAYPTLDQSNLGTCIIDPAGAITHANKTFLDLLEYEKSELLGENVKILCEEPIRSLHDGFLRRYAAGGQSRLVGLKARDVFALTKSGSRKHIMVKISEIGRPSGAVNFLCIAQPYDTNAVSDDPAVTSALQAIERE